MQPQLSSNSLQYLGVNAPQPANVILGNRAPVTSDVAYPLGTIWVYASASSSWILVNVAAGVATWNSI